MGGHAIESAVRLNKDDYHEFANGFLAQSFFKGYKANIIPAYRSKPDFGDLDIVVAGDVSVLADRIQSAMNVVQRVNNGPVVSLGVNTVHGIFQVDLVKVEYFDFAMRYFSFNDLGNLMGRIAHNIGFKFGQQGLVYPLRNPLNENEMIGDIHVTGNFNWAIRFMGYDDHQYQKNVINRFDMLEDVFKFAASSCYFNPDIFPLEVRGHQQRVRDAKRPTYMKFLRWIDENYKIITIKERDEKIAERDDLRAHMLEKAFNDFPGFKLRYDNAMTAFEKKKRVAEKFNGKRVSDITSLDGEELGEFIRDFKKLFEDDECFKEWIDHATQEHIDGAIQNHQRGIEAFFHSGNTALRRPEVDDFYDDDQWVRPLSDNILG